MKRLYAVYPYLAVNFMPSVSTNDLKLCIIHEDITSHTRIIGLSVASPELRLLGGVLNRTL